MSVHSDCTAPDTAKLCLTAQGHWHLQYHEALCPTPVQSALHSPGEKGELL